MSHAALFVLILATPLLFGGVMHAVVAPYLLPAFAPAAVAGGLCVGWVMRRWSRAFGVVLLSVYTISAIGLTVEVRRGIARGVGNGVPLRERMEMIDDVADAAGGSAFYLMQDARNPDTGLDVAYVYLGYWRHLSDQMLPAPSGSSPLFVLREWNTHMRDEPAVFLHGCPIIDETHHLVLYEIPPGRRAEWLDLLRRFPAPQR